MDPRFADLTCPKCGGTMRAQERQGVVIDVCGQCRGVFLDRGELDRLLDLEAASVPYGNDRPYADRPHPAGSGVGLRRDWDDDDDDDDRGRLRGGYGDRHGDPYGDPRYAGDRPRRRRGGFLGDLLEGFGD